MYYSISAMAKYIGKDLCDSFVQSFIDLANEWLSLLDYVDFSKLNVFVFVFVLLLGGGGLY